MSQALLFVDRDGTLCEEPIDYKIDSLAKIKLLPDVIPSLLRLKRGGYSLVMVSNQDGLGTPGYSRCSFNTCHDFIIQLFASQGLVFDLVLICPHYTYELCPCRKPQTEGIKSLLNQRPWNPTLSAMVGDRDTDMQFAANLRVKGLRVDSPFAKGLSWPSIADILLAN